MSLLAILHAVAALTAGAISLPARWNHGTPGEPALQVHEAAPGTWILRQGKGSNFEAPFQYLIAGEERALLLDTGAEPVARSDYPLRETVDRLLAQWAWSRGRKSLPLVVAHSHSHGDHHFGDAQFADRAETRIVGLRPEDVAAFFALDRWPQGEATFGLGKRDLAVLPLPGHEPSHIALYDAATRTLFSGDTLYPGLITVRDWPAFRASVAHLDAFADTHPVDQVLGAHIEMTDAPWRMYPLETRYQPKEHRLALMRTHLHELAQACAEIGDFIADDVHTDFVIGRILKPSNDKPSQHGMLVLGTDVVYVSHLPMLHSPHDYQLVAEVELPAADLAAFRDDAKAHPGEIYTLAPTQNWVLPDTIRADAHFNGDLYRGHFERGGRVMRAGITVTVKNLVHFRRFEPARAPDYSRWIAFGRGKEHFLAHRIEGQGDTDQILSVNTALREGQAVKANFTRAAKAGDHVGDLSVQRVLYTETTDLK